MTSDEKKLNLEEYKTERGTDVVSSKYRLILDDNQRQFCSSFFVRLEILAKAQYYQKKMKLSSI